MIIALVALVSLLVGIAIALVIALGIVVSQLADLKAYTTTVIARLQCLISQHSPPR